MTNIIDINGTPAIILENNSNFKYTVFKAGQNCVYYKLKLPGMVEDTINECFVKNTGITLGMVIRIKEGLLLDILSYDEDPDTRYYVICNHYTSRKTLERLMDDIDLNVSKKAIDRLNALDDEEEL